MPDMANIVVQKYGGSSLSAPDKIKAVARRIVATKEKGFQVVAVVSAMGKSTDHLLELVKSVTDTPKNRELDMLLSTGERISMALLSMAIHDLGHEAISFTGSQCGIITNDSHSNAKIIEVRPVRIQDELAKGRIVILAGFQGMSYRREITTLGRGGSDTTAVALAASLNARYCEICSDVAGVYSADPNSQANARPISELSYDEMEAIGRAGAKVLNPDAIEFARQRGLEVWLTSTFDEKELNGTLLLRPHAQTTRAVAVARRDRWLRVHLITETPEDVDTLLHLLRNAEVAEAEVNYVLEANTKGQITVGLDPKNLHSQSKLQLQLYKAFSDRLRFEEHLACVSVLGNRVGQELSFMIRAFEVLRRSGVEILETWNDLHGLHVMVQSEAASQAETALHDLVLRSPSLTHTQEPA